VATDSCSETMSGPVSSSLTVTTVATMLAVPISSRVVDLVGGSLSAAYAVQPEA